VKLKVVAAVVVIIVVASVCVRLGFWQLSRWDQKKTENARRAAAMSAAPLEAGSELLTAAAPPALQLKVHGRYDEQHQILLSARAHDGSPGVHVVTPLVFDDGSGAVLINRGWVYAGDASTARPLDHSEPGEHTVIGVAERIGRGITGAPWRNLSKDSASVWSARWLDRDSIAARFPYAVAPLVVNQLPGDGVPAIPARIDPQPLDEMMHVSYAVQWFLFGTILVAGSILVAARSRRGRGNDPVPGEM
jgi:surfeit locus 1 family protein